jgi:hypothetical protein
MGERASSSGSSAAGEAGTPGVHEAVGHELEYGIDIGARGLKFAVADAFANERDSVHGGCTELG